MQIIFHGYAAAQILKKSRTETLALQRQITRDKNLFKKTNLYMNF